MDSQSNSESTPAPTQQQSVEKIIQAREAIRRELAKVIIGQSEVIEQILVSLFAGGHCLITGAPGLAKTLLIKSIARIFHLKFQRVQFTPDLMPADITGTEILGETGTGRAMQFVPGPIFANMVLADEINRTPPKTQAALLEAMQEHQVTAGGVKHALPSPFFVLATQNPVEMEGTYPLPEAQLDRFMFNVVIDYLPERDEVEVVKQTTARSPQGIEALFTGEDVLSFQSLVRDVPVSDEVVRRTVRLVAASRPGQPGSAPFVKEWLNWGAGTRAGQNLILGAKVRALLNDRTHVLWEDVLALAKPVLRHRILTNYRAEAEGITVDSIIERLIQHVETGAVK